MRSFRSTMLFLGAGSLAMVALWTARRCRGAGDESVKNKATSLISFSTSLPNAITKENLAPIAILGSGPAGSSAALYCGRARTPVYVLRGDHPGGQLMTTTYVENWPGIGKVLGPDAMRKLEEQAVSFGAIMVPNKIVKVDFSTWPYQLWTEEGTVIHALAVIIATGSNARTLNIPGEKEYHAHGVSSCAVCDAPFFRDVDVMVVGGGDSAAEEALQIAPYAKHVTLVVRGEKMRASAIMQERLKDTANIKILYNAQITEILGDGEFVTKVKINVQGEEKEMPINGVFPAIGHDPNTKLFKGQIALDDQGYIILEHRTQHTSLPGIFAAGDVADNHYRQAGVASGDGIKAALDALDFLRQVGFTGSAIETASKNYFEPEINLKNVSFKQIVTRAEFDTEVVANKKAVLLDFYTPMCSECNALLPSIASVAHKFKETLDIFKIDASKSTELAELLIVPTVPTLVLYHDGNLIARATGFMSKQELYNFVKTALS